MRILRLVVVAATLSLSAVAEAQKATYWRIPSGLGGAMIGAGVGWAGDVMRWNAEECGFCGPTLTLTPIGIAAGGIIGYIAGVTADERLAKGDSLGSGRRKWLRVATFLTPPAIGSTAAYLIIDGDDYECVPSGFGCVYRDKKKFADDETVALVGIGGGVLLGYVLQHKTKGALYPRVTAGTGSLGLSFSYTF